MPRLTQRAFRHSHCITRLLLRCSPPCGLRFRLSAEPPLALARVDLGLVVPGNTGHVVDVLALGIIRAGACLPALRRVDIQDADALAVDLDRVAIDDRGVAGDRSAFAAEQNRAKTD